MLIANDTDRETAILEWEIAAKILEDHGCRTGDYLLRAVRATDDHEALRRWFAIADKVQSLAGPEGRPQ